ncbi:MAG: saccharopine dehydrogenase C-terminal domain-containing protein [Gemmobacter sp.]|nr:saccharopine dehydrogenase C-terminal domain-containing protein [Gemmobacter sp.]
MNSAPARSGQGLPVLVLGAGRAGRRIAGMLAQDPRFAPRIAGLEPEGMAQAHAEGLPLAAFGDLQPRDALARLIGAAQAVVVTDGTFSGPEVARLAQAAGCHYLDILESPRSAALLADLSVVSDGKQACCIAPGCGLAPGHVTALAADLLDSAGPDADVTVFAGVLPQVPENRLGYANIWGIEGLIEEYTQPCAAIRDGSVALLPPMDGAEDLLIAGQSYEAFTTAGSIDGLTTRYAGKVRSLVFKTLRYPRHLDYIRFLMQDLGLSQRIYQLRSLLMTSLPQTESDRVLIAIRLIRSPGDAPEWQTQVFEAETDACGRVLSAIGTATAAHVCATLDLLTRPNCPWTGLVAPGTIRPADLRRSPFFVFLDPGADVGQSGQIA